jgi:sulfur-oxidizing protein SoxY
MLQRRIFLKLPLASSVIIMAVTSGLLTPKRVLGNWNKAAFNATRLQSALKSALGSDLTEASDKITIQAPEVAENGAVVQLTVSSKLENTQTITLFSAQNRTPLIAQFELDKDTQAYISTRIKMAKTSNVIAVVTADGKHYSARKEIKILVGGC